jgi:hypothetical protein
LKYYYQEYEIDNVEKLYKKEKYLENYKKSNIKQIPFKKFDGTWTLTDLKLNDCAKSKFIQKLPTQSGIKLILVVNDDVEIQYNKKIVHYCDLNTIRDGSIKFATRIKNEEIEFYNYRSGFAYLWM